MDLGTIIGLVLGFSLIGGAMVLGGGIMPFIDAQSARPCRTRRGRDPRRRIDLKGENSMVIQSKLESFLSPEERGMSVHVKGGARLKPGSDSLLLVSFVFLDEVIRITEEFP